MKNCTTNNNLFTKLYYFLNVSKPRIWSAIGSNHKVSDSLVLKTFLKIFRHPSTFSHFRTVFFRPIYNLVWVLLLFRSLSVSDSWNYRRYSLYKLGPLKNC